MYGLVALGYHITWVTSRTMNFSQGHAVMAGAVVAFAFYVGLGWPLWATVLATLVLLAIFGVVLERVAVRPFFRAGSAAWLLSTIACGIIAENVAMLTFGKDARAFPSALTQKPIPVGAVFCTECGTHLVTGEKTESRGMTPISWSGLVFSEAVT